MLTQDEVIGVAFEDHILYCVIALIDPRLTHHIHQHHHPEDVPEALCLLDSINIYYERKKSL